MQQLLLQMCELVLTAHESVPKPVPDFLVFGVPELVFDLGSPHTRCEIGFFLRWCPCWADLYS